MDIGHHRYLFIARAKNKHFWYHDFYAPFQWGLPEVPTVLLVGVLRILRKLLDSIGGYHRYMGYAEGWYHRYLGGTSVAYHLVSKSWYLYQDTLSIGKQQCRRYLPPEGGGVGYFLISFKGRECLDKVGKVSPVSVSTRSQI